MSNRNKTLHYNSNTRHRSADASLAEANTAISALLGGIREAMRPAHGANYGHSGTAHAVVERLLAVYAMMTSAKTGDSFELPTDDGRRVAFRLEDL